MKTYFLIPVLFIALICLLGSCTEDLQQITPSKQDPIESCKKIISYFDDLIITNDKKGNLPECQKSKGFRTFSLKAGLVEWYPEYYQKFVDCNLNQSITQPFRAKKQVNSISPLFDLVLDRDGTYALIYMIPISRVYVDCPNEAASIPFNPPSELISDKEFGFYKLFTDEDGINKLVLSTSSGKEIVFEILLTSNTDLFSSNSIGIKMKYSTKINVVLNLES